MSRVVPSATLQIAVIPKRMLTLTEAALYCGRPVSRFKTECPCSPVRFPNRDLRYDVHNLDRWLDSLAEKKSLAEPVASKSDGNPWDTVLPHADKKRTS